ncbi:RNA-binding transcriptional accessory protein [Alginatibacterium sediminis]|uniref:RNA-binding transcriptional accessory protein n=1 Tax=Alginatibacterium sediminis TaxID=2164068 RepID=A0A420EL81_9ALTE|nr:Tex family protein [Alginatibacterium sediminis]RKF21472.1 RNA-binding transcriptional accessory protein [Alginatibacterium sediminis]
MSEHTQFSVKISRQIASEIGCKPQQVEATLALIDEGCTIPFIARYRKEKTGGLDDEQLRTLESRLAYLTEFEQRRVVIIKAIEELGQLDPNLLNKINGASSKTELEDLYLPYKSKRRTKGQIAIEAGLGELAKQLFQNPNQVPELLAKSYLNEKAGFSDVKLVLDGARSILAEQFATDSQLIGKLRKLLEKHASLVSRLVPAKEQEAQKFRDYFDYQELISKLPSHRALALLRGKQAGYLRLKLALPEHLGPQAAIELIANHLQIRSSTNARDSWLTSVVSSCWQTKLSPSLETELIAKLRQRSEQEAISVFAKNLKDLLLAAPAGTKTTLALDPGLRTGVKVAVVDATGKVLDTDTIFPHAPRNQWSQSLSLIEKLVKKHSVELISIGNGTASRETEKLVAEMQSKMGASNLQRVMVSEAGASVYSASKLAAQEFPNMDVTLRGAVSIGRRLQDPLAELVKIDPKAIGVGQYQHDVNQVDLNRQLDTVVEDCVNAVGVELNSASAPLLSHVSGLSASLAENIVAYRDLNGAFSARSQLKKVPRLGPKAFEQAAGFLRIRGAKNPLDNSGVHPEAYPIVKAMQQDSGLKIDELLNNSKQLEQLDLGQYVNDQFGLPTVKDVVAELEKPGRDPRPEFKTASFKDGVETINDLAPNQRLEGVVTNVTNFGAFVDIGVHQDGLVHISMLADGFVKDPHLIVKAGDIVKVTVLEVDIQRKRIALSMRSEVVSAQTVKPSQAPMAKSSTNHRIKAPTKKQSKPTNSAFADAFATLKNSD